MTNALASMRVDYEEQMRLKEVDLSTNPLLSRRKKGGKSSKSSGKGASNK